MPLGLLVARFTGRNLANCGQILPVEVADRERVHIAQTRSQAEAQLSVVQAFRPACCAPARSRAEALHYVRLVSAPPAGFGTPGFLSLPRSELNTCRLRDARLDPGATESDDPPGHPGEY